MASYTHFSSASSTLLSPSSAPASSSSSPPPLLRLRLLLGIKRWYGDWRSTFPNSEPLSASAFCFPGIFWAAIRRVGSWNSRDIRSCIQYKSPAAQGKQPLAPPSYRPLVNKTSMQPISHVPQQHLSTSPATSQPQQQHQSEGQLQQKPLPHPHQPARVQGPVSQKGTSPAMLTQPPVSQPGNQAKTVSSENEVSDNRILGKRNIHELLQQIDPSENWIQRLKPPLPILRKTFWSQSQLLAVL
ncbi:hypothetical protein YC2023_006279 [Brassica napus]